MKPTTNDTPGPQRSQMQDDESFAQIVKDHQRVVLGLGQSMGLRGADLDDAAAEVFANVYRALPGFQGRSALGTWIYQIAFRTLRKFRARASRHRTSEMTIEPADVGQRPPEQASIDGESKQRIWKAVAALEPRQAMAVELCYRRGWGLEQIAETMSCPVGTVKTLLFRARDHLRRSLAKEVEAP